MDNKKIISKFMDAVWVNQDLDAIDTFFYPDAVIHSPFNAKKGACSMREIAEKWLQAFPDLEFMVHDMITEGDKVVTRWTAIGTHVGSFFATSATHKEVKFSGVTTCLLESDRIKEYWNLVDMHAILSTLGKYDCINEVLE